MVFPKLNLLNWYLVMIGGLMALRAGDYGGVAGAGTILKHRRGDDDCGGESVNGRSGFHASAL